MRLVAAGAFVAAVVAAQPCVAQTAAPTQPSPSALPAPQRDTPARPAPDEPKPQSRTGDTPPARAFSAPAGLLFNTVKPERVADFEKVIAYLQAALDKTTDPTVRAQARGWRVFKAAEPGPNGTVLYVFAIDPTVPGADYGLGRILAEAYPDAAKLTEIWNLYTGAVTSGGSLLNLTEIRGADGTPEPSTQRPPDAAPQLLQPGDARRPGAGAP